MKNLLRYLAFALMVGGACAQSKSATEWVEVEPNNVIDGYNNRQIDLSSVASIGTGNYISYSIRFRNKEYTPYSANRFVVLDCVNYFRLETSTPLNPGMVNYVKQDTKFDLESKMACGKANLANKYASNFIQDNQSVISNLNKPNSSLPSCKGNDLTNWNGCFGTWETPYSKYEGEFKDGQREGKGSLTYPNGDTYTGGFKNGQLDGQVFYSNKSGEKYVGSYKNNLRNGLGQVTFANGDVYIGEFKDNRVEGQGTASYINGSKHEGQWKNNKSHGRGTLTFANGNAYTGDFKDGVKNGQGFFTFSNGSKYEGEFLDDKISGKGTYTFPNGEKYVGDHENGIFNGQGIATYKNGNRFVGEFKDGKLHGEGILFALDGATIKQGKWVDGNFAIAMPTLQINLANIEKVNAELEQIKRKQPEDEGRLRFSQQPIVQTTQVVNFQPMSKRLALVVGNANYKTRPLRNPRNDADDVSNALKANGFQVIDLRDASLQQMRNGVRQFGDRLINNDVGLVYYSGHGVEVKGRNYFIPVNADIMREDEIADQGLDVSLILEKMNTAGKGVNILIVDACRDDPFGRSFRSSSRGLAQMDAPRGTIIAYATSPGKVASDGDGRNSPYTKNLVKAMQQPNKPIEQVFKEVRRAVQEETKNLQTPWENTSLSGDFYFKVQR